MKLTLPQQDVYYEQLLYPGEPIYNIGARIAIDGPVDYNLLAQAYTVLIREHDSYRSLLSPTAEGIEVVISGDDAPSLPLVDFSGHAQPDEEASRYMQSLFRQPFDLLSGAPLYRFLLVRVSSGRHYLFSVYHHLITDGWGTSLMFQRLVKNYNELATQGSISTRYPYSYATFAEDDADYASSPAFAEDRDYWKQKFSPLPETLFEKIDRGLSVNRSSRKTLAVPRALYNRLEALAKSLGCSTFHVILAVLYLYFGRKHRNTDFAIGLPVLNRGKSVFKKTVGLFMGVSPLRISFSCSDSFADLVANIKNRLRQDYRHQRFPLGRLVQELGAFARRDQLFNITVSYEKQDYADHFAGTTTTVIPLSHGAERVAIALYIREFDADRDVNIDFDYNLNYFDEETIGGVVAHINNLLQSVCDDAARPLARLGYLGDAEQEQLLLRFNDTQVDYPADKTLLDLFSEWVNKKPGAPAVADDDRRYTYAELDEEAARIARRLPPGDGPIAVLMPRSARLVAVLLGVLKSGRAFIPLDPAFPADRLRYIVGHSRAACIAGTDEFKNLFEGTPFISIDAMNDSNSELPTVSSSGDAYIIYTSGSTGQPKGVVVGHRSLLNFLLSMQRRPGLAEGDLFFSVTTQSFDISMLEFFGPLVSGGSIYIAGREVVLNPPVLVARLQALRPAIIQATPSLYQLLFDAGWPGDERLKVLCGGDLLGSALAAQLLRSCAELWNMYGPTETTIWSSLRKITDPEQSSNIGRPIANTQLYILDDCGQLLPVGMAGELHIGGDGLAKGYHRAPELTAERFIDDPFHEGKKIYRTGDLARWTADGTVDFLGRNDHQVKIRGYRIELGEIESRIDALPSVHASVVVAHKGNGDVVLVAYVVPGEKDIDTVFIRSALQEVLPAYMVPQVIVPLDSFPLTPNKKIDRKQLASRPIEAVASPEAAPATALEEQLCGLFGEALGHSIRINTGDDFFALGGHSLNAMKLVNLVENRLQYKLALRTVFDFPTVQALALHLGRQQAVAQTGITVSAPRPWYPLTPAQYAIWLAAQGNEERSSAYNVFNLYEISGALDIDRLQNAFLRLIEKYEVLRTRFAEREGGPAQLFVSATDFTIDRIDPADDEWAAMEDYVNRPFDLESGLLLRAGLFVKEGRSFLAFATHHIIMDGWSVEILMRAVVDQYRGEGVDEALPFQFRDYIDWLETAAAAREETNRTFWTGYLEGHRWKTAPTASLEPAAGEQHFEWTGDFFSSLRGAVRRQGTTLHNFLAAAFFILWHRQEGDEDMCIGTVNSGRTLEGLHEQLGMFVKTLPLRVRLDPAASFTQLLASVQAGLLGIDAHQDLPADIYSRLRLDVLFVLQPLSFNYDAIELAQGLRLSALPIAQRFSRLPLLVNFREDGDALRCTLTYDKKRWTAEAIDVLMMKYEKVLVQLIENAHGPIEDLDSSLVLPETPALDFEFDF